MYVCMYVCVYACMYKWPVISSYSFGSSTIVPVTLINTTTITNTLTICRLISLVSTFS